MTPENPDQLHLGEEPLSAEQLAEAERLQHGINSLELLGKEDAAEAYRADYLRKTRAGSESRAEILAGPSFGGDEKKLANAIFKARRRFAVNAIRRKSMVEYAAYRGVEATEEGDRVVVPEEDRQELSEGYVRWRMRFAGPQSRIQREMYGRFLDTGRRKITGETGGPDMLLEPGPMVSLEDRAVLLTRAINAMARRSMLSGLNVALPDEQYNEPIFKRYEDDTPQVDVATLRKRQRLLRAVKRDFWQASGYPQLRSSGLIKEHLLDRKASKMWDEFAGQFEHSPQQGKREELRDRLREFIPEERLPETSIEGL